MYACEVVEGNEGWYRSEVVRCGANQQGETRRQARSDAAARKHHTQEYGKNNLSSLILHPSPLITQPRPHSSSLNSHPMTQHHAASRSTTQHYAALHSPTQPYAALRSPTQHHAPPRTTMHHHAPPCTTTHHHAAPRSTTMINIVLQTTREKGGLLMSSRGLLVLQPTGMIHFIIFSSIHSVLLLTNSVSCNIESKDKN